MLCLTPAGAGLGASVSNAGLHEMKNALDIRDLGISDQVLVTLLDQECSPGVKYRDLAEVACRELSYAACLRQRNLDTALDLLKGIEDINGWLLKFSGFLEIGADRTGNSSAGDSFPVFPGLMSSMLQYDVGGLIGDGQDPAYIPSLNGVISRYLTLRGYDGDDQKAWQKVKNTVGSGTSGFGRYFPLHEQAVHTLARHSWVAAYHEPDVRSHVQALGQRIRHLVSRYRAYESGQNIGIFTRNAESVRIVNYGHDCISQVVLRDRMTHRSHLTCIRSGGCQSEDKSAGQGIKICGQSQADILANGDLDRVSHLDFIVLGVRVSLPFAPVPVRPGFPLKTDSPAQYAPCKVEVKMADAGGAKVTQAVKLPATSRNPLPVKNPLAVSTGPLVFLPDRTTIDYDTVWSPSRVYVLCGKVVIAQGAALIIEPGVVVKGRDHGSRLVIDGTLAARGTEQSPVVFTSLKDDAWGGDTNTDNDKSSPAAGDWDGISFTDTSIDAACILDHCLIRYGGHGSQAGTILCDRASPAISNCTISHNRTCGFRLQDASPSISHCTIANNSSAGILCEGSSAPAIKGCTISGNSSFGIYSSGTCAALITGNTFSANGSFAVYLACTRTVSIFDNTVSDLGGGICLSGMISADTLLGNNPDCPYVVNSLTVAEGATLTIEPGVIIKGDNQYGRLTINGGLEARGTEQAPIVFTSLKDDACGGDTNNDQDNSLPAAGDWDGISFSSTSNDTACILEHCIIRYGGYGSKAGAVSCSSASPAFSRCIISNNRTSGLSLQNAAPLISHCTIADNGSAGILCEGNSEPVVVGCTIKNNRSCGICSFGTSAPAITANSFSDNGSFAVYLSCTRNVATFGNTASGSGSGIYLLGTIAADSRLANNPDCPYVLGSLTIAEGAAVTIDPGVVIKGFAQGSGLAVSGALTARGTEQAPIVFTSLKDDAYGGDTNNDQDNSSPAAGDWDGISFADTSSDAACILDYCLIRYGGYGSRASAVFCDNASPSFNRCTISNSLTCGLRLQDASPAISHCTIADNSSPGILAEGNSGPPVTGCTIRNNKTCGIHSIGTSTPVITGNSFSDNGTFAAYLYCTGNVVISDNTVRDCGGGICLSGMITADTRLGNNPDCPYMLNGLTIAEGATLTMEPEITIRGRNQCTWLIINGVPATHERGSSPAGGGEKMAGEKVGVGPKNPASLPKLRWR
ncbi:MAG: right-handed parallel beta-helix repeat-containing protein [bacterium]